MIVIIPGKTVSANENDGYFVAVVGKVGRLMNLVVQCLT
jgi:hypothetical protein